MPERTALDVAYDQQVFAVRKQLLSQSRAFWNGLGSYRDADFERLVEILVPRIESGQKRVSDLTAAYLSRTMREEVGVGRGELPSSTPVSTQDLRGVPAEEVYHRPFVSTYAALDEGRGLAAAKAAGLERLFSLVATGIQLSKTHTARRVLGRNGQKMYQRVLTGRENCALCVIASTQRYWVKDLSPMHPGCDCAVKPWNGPDEQVIYPDMLEEVHGAVTAEFGNSDRSARLIDGKGTVSDYLDLIVTYQHGELGPTLAWRNQKHTILP